jgi:hypothetical protein
VLQEYDVIKSRHDINTKVQKGAIGTILSVHWDTPPRYEVEFIDEEGNTLDVTTVLESDIELKF